MDPERVRTTADDVALRRLFFVLVKKRQQMPGVPRRRMFSPFHLKWNKGLAAFDDEINFRAGADFLVIDPSASKILKTFPYKLPPSPIPLTSSVYFYHPISIHSIIFPYTGC
jgi:hypothetical protein